MLATPYIIFMRDSGHGHLFRYFDGEILAHASVPWADDNDDWRPYLTRLLGGDQLWGPTTQIFVEKAYYTTGEKCATKKSVLMTYESLQHNQHT